MKEKYQIPEADFVRFQTEDIITTSIEVDTAFEEENPSVEQIKLIEAKL